MGCLGVRRRAQSHPVMSSSNAGAGAIGRLGPTPPPGAGGPRPSPRFGAHTAWKHFFQMVALGSGPSNQNRAHQQANNHHHHHHHHHTKSEQGVRTTDGSTTTAFGTDGSTDTSSDAPSIRNVNSDLPLLKDSAHRQIERIFKTLRCSGVDYILRDTLVDFLVEVQGGLVRPLEKEIYTLGDFIYVWLHDYSAALRPPGKKDMSKPITNYFISSSHNTYIGLGNQLSGEVSADAYRTVLEGDCRCVEIDVWNGEGWSEPRPRTPSRSRSPRRSDRKRDRHLSNLSTKSTSSLPGAAQSLADLVDQKWHELARRHDQRNSHKPKTAGGRISRTFPGLPDARNSTASLDHSFLDPNDIGRPLRHVRSAEWRDSKSPKAPSPSSRSREPHKGKIEPEVTHAHTVQGLGDLGLARRIPLREVCQVIKKHAFKTNKLPLIVSLEVHATGEQQDMMADIMKEEWGEHLLDERLADCNPNERQPALGELMEKILVKVKKPAGRLSKGKSQLTVPLMSMHDDDASGSEDERLFDTTGRGVEVAQAVKTSKTKIGEALGRLAIYTHSEHYKDFSTPAAQTLSHIFSIDEYKILKLHQTKHREMFIHNRKYFMRAYPHSTRVTSTNLEPALYWRKGVQMVALNWQRSHVDEAMMLNSAMFESEQGWTLKPQGYLSSDDSSSQAEAAWHGTLERLRITVLAGQHLPFPGESDHDSRRNSVSTVSTSDSTGFRPLVKCELHVETPEERNEKKAIKNGLVQDGQYKMMTKSSETENPDWGAGQVLEFPVIENVVEELSFVRFKIEDEGLVKDKLAAWACIRLDRLQQGYRFIDLKDAHGKHSAGKLLVQIEKTVQ